MPQPDAAHASAASERAVNEVYRANNADLNFSLFLPDLDLICGPGAEAAPVSTLQAQGASGRTVRETVPHTKQATRAAQKDNDTKAESRNQTGKTASNSDGAKGRECSSVERDEFSRPKRIAFREATVEVNYAGANDEVESLVLVRQSDTKTLKKGADGKFEINGEKYDKCRARHDGTIVFSNANGTMTLKPDGTIFAKNANGSEVSVEFSDESSHMYDAEDNLITVSENRCALTLAKEKATIEVTRVKSVEEFRRVLSEARKVN